MSEKKSFVIYDNWSALLCDLNDEEAGILIKAICAYKLGKEFEINDSVILAIFNMVKTKLDEDSKKYEEICKKRSEAGKKGGAPIGNKNRLKQANDINSKQKQTKQPDTDTDTDTDTDKDINKREGDKSPRSFKPPTLEEVTAYCLEKGFYVDPQQFVDFYSSKGWMVGKTKMKDWKASVRTWERRTRGDPKSKIEIDKKFRQSFEGNEVIQFNVGG